MNLLINISCCFVFDFIQDLNMSMELESSTGQRVLATIVFGQALRFFKDSCIKELNDVSITQSSFSADDIQWVVTVPAIWRQSAKQFMRHAAVQVSIEQASCLCLLQ